MFWRCCSREGKETVRVLHAGDERAEGVRVGDVAGLGGREGRVVDVWSRTKPCVGIMVSHVVIVQFCVDVQIYYLYTLYKHIVFHPHLGEGGVEQIGKFG